jgi:hypothetical protein
MRPASQLCRLTSQSACRMEYPICVRTPTLVDSHSYSAPMRADTSGLMPRSQTCSCRNAAATLQVTHTELAQTVLVKQPCHDPCLANVKSISNTQKAHCHNAQQNTTWPAHHQTQNHHPKNLKLESGVPTPHCCCTRQSSSRRSHHSTAATTQPHRHATATEHCDLLLAEPVYLNHQNHQHMSELQDVRKCRPNQPHPQLG